MISRRDFLKYTAMTGAALSLPLSFGVRNAMAFYQSTPIPLWGTTLRGVGPGGISVAVPDGWPGTPIPAEVTGVTHYTINVNEFTDQLVPASTGLGPTTLWGYHGANSLGAQSHLGGIIVATKGSPVQITFRNNLPNRSLVPIDRSIPGANQADNRIAVHLHGGHIPWISDGGPHDWWAPDGTHGPSFLNNLCLRTTPAAANEAEYYYNNDQSARFAWYHDHAWGITRTNAYCGIASAYVIRDAEEINLKNMGLPEFIENSVLGGTLVQELPLVVQDKIFVGTNIATADPTWSGISSPGSLWYAHVYDTLRYGPLGPAPNGAPVDPSCVPEFYGDTMLMNGTAYPDIPVEPRRYRLRILNACQAKFLNLQMYVDDGTPNGITLAAKTFAPLNKPARNAATKNPSGKPTSTFLVIGTEGGFLPKPALVPSNVPFNGTTTGGSMLQGPAERTDVIWDFSLHANQNIILYTDAPSPFPAGSPLNDYFPGLANGNPVNLTTPAGNGPNTRILARFKVGATTSGNPDPALAINTTTALVGDGPLPVPAGVTVPPPGVPVRVLTLNESFDGWGRLQQLVGTGTMQAGGGFGLAYLDPATEIVPNGTQEVWQIINLTADTHPMHFHLFNCQIISRAPLLGKYKGGVPNTGTPAPPLPYEAGWKETVRMDPGTVTTIIMTMVVPPITGPDGVTPVDLSFACYTDSTGVHCGTTGGMPPVSPRTGGNEYVWHCHILEHEEHDMMRPLVIT